MHRFQLHNDQILETAAACLVPGQVGVLNGWGVFSTIRVSRGVLFAWERHYARMKRDAELLRVPFPGDPSYIEQRLLRLVEANRAFDATLRVVVIRNKGGMFEAPGLERDFDIVAFTKELADWGTGVRLHLLEHGRHADSPHAGTKVASWMSNLVFYEGARLRGFDEVVLLNERGEVSECTSANIFASMGDRILTPPLSSGCLPGVTRELVVNGPVTADGLAVEEKVLMPADLEAADEVFISSTTRDLLPVAEIEGLRIKRQGTARERLAVAFQKYLDDYVAGKRVG